MEDLEDVNEDLQARIVANMVPPTTIGKDAIEVLSDFGIPMAGTQLGYRTAYRESALYGGTVHDTGSKGKAAVAEMEALADEICEILDIKTNTHKAVQQG